MADASKSKSGSALKNSFKRIQRALGNRRTRAMGYVLIGAAAVILLYLFLLVGRNRQFLEARNFRSLAALGKQIESVLDSQSRVLPASGTKLEGELNPTTSRVTIKSPLIGEQRFSLESQGLRRSKENAGNGPDLVFLFYQVHPRDPWLITPTSQAGSGEEITFAAEPLAPIVQPLLQRPEFDHVFLLDEDGYVIVEQDDRRLRLDKFKRRDDIPWKSEEEANGAADDEPSTLDDGLYRRVKLGGQSYELFLMPLVPQKVAELPREKADGAKDTYGPLESPEWRLGGLIRTERFTQTTYRLPVSLILILFGLILLSLAFLPIVKAAFLGKRQSLTRVETVWMFLSLVTLSAALAVAFPVLWQRSVMWHHVDDQLEGLAKNIQNDFAGQINTLHQALNGLAASFDKTLIRDQDRDSNTRRVAFHQVLDRLQEVSKDNEEQVHDELRSLKGNSHLRLPSYVNNVYWIDQGGRQRLKINRGGRLALLNVSDREYFQHFLHDSESESPFVQPIHSWTTGEPEVVVSTPWDSGETEDQSGTNGDPSSKPDSPLKVLAVAARLSSVIEPMIPPGYGFAIVQGRSQPLGPMQKRRNVPVGEVLLQSDPRLNLRSNILEDSEDSPWLEATLRTEVTDEKTVRYRGQNRHFRVQPLRLNQEDQLFYGTESWRIVTFADSAPWNAWIIQTLGLWFFLFLIYLVWLFLLYLAYRWLQSRLQNLLAVRWTPCPNPFNKLWFNSRSDYSWSFLLGPFVFVFACAVLSIRYPAFVVSLLPLPFIWLIFARGARPCDDNESEPPAPDQDARRSRKRAYKICVVLTLLTLGFLPSWLCYSLAFDVETDLFVIQQQYETVQERKAREARRQRRGRELRFQAQADDTKMLRSVGKSHDVRGLSLGVASWPSTHNETTRNADEERRPQGRYDELFYSQGLVEGQPENNGWLNLLEHPRTRLEWLRVPWTAEGQRSGAFLNPAHKPFEIHRRKSWFQRSYRLTNFHPGETFTNDSQGGQATTTTWTFFHEISALFKKWERLLLTLFLGFFVLVGLIYFVRKAFWQIQPKSIPTTLKPQKSLAVHFWLVPPAKGRLGDLDAIPSISIIDLRGSAAPKADLVQSYLEMDESQRHIFLLDAKARKAIFTEQVGRFGLVVPLADRPDESPRTALREDLDSRILDDIATLEKWLREHDALYKLDQGYKDLYEPVWEILGTGSQTTTENNADPAKPVPTAYPAPSTFPAVWANLAAPAVPATPEDETETPDDTVKLPEPSILQSILLHLAQGHLVANGKLEHELKILYRTGLAEPQPQPAITKPSWHRFLLEKSQGSAYRAGLKTVEDKDVIDAVPIVRLILALLGFGGLLFLAITQGEIVQEATTQVAVPLGIVAALLSLANTWKGLEKATP